MNNYDSPPLKFMYQNHQGKVGLRSVHPCSIVYEEGNRWHGDSWLIKAYDYDKQQMRDFCVDDVIIGTIIQTLKTMKIVATEDRIQGIMDKMKQY